MTTKVSSVSFRIDAGIKDQADRLFAELGLNMTTAFNIFLRQSIREGGLPFAVTTSIPNDTTVAAMLEAKGMLSNPSIQRFNVEDALVELKP
ncbi:MAG: type II toxin-antitoxin system RelB/DinJ family antitoxin [Eggerthellaceae bacterium]|nr:type II toxin-antitoxin system RelB/DinJ family antitoxin [Eggerthellaceae bacterium]